MQKLPQWLHAVTHFYKGGGHVPKPPKPPTPITAAENLSKNRVLDRQRLARGFSSTILGGYEATNEQPATMFKTLLGG